MVVFGPEQGSAVKRELQAANRRVDAAVRGRDWSAKALRDAVYRITSDAVIGLYGRVMLHHDRVVTPSGAFPLCREISAGVETAHRIAAAELAAFDPPAAQLNARRLFLYVSAPAGQHLEPCRPGDLLKARVFASRITSAARTLEFELDPAERLLDLARRYEQLEAPDSSVRRALSELRELEARLSAEQRLPRRYRPRASPPSLPALQA